MKQRKFKFDKVPCYYNYFPETRKVEVYVKERHVTTIQVDEEPINDTPAFGEVLHAIELKTIKK